MGREGFFPDRCQCHTLKGYGTWPGMVADGFLGPYDTLNGGALRCFACAVAMPFNHCLDDLDNLFLLTAGQPGGGLKYQLQPAFSRLAFWLWRRDAQQFIHADAQGVRQFRQHFPTRRCAAQFPKRDVGMMDAQLFAQRHLR